MSDLVQMNLSVDPDVVETVKRLATKHGWSKRETVTTAVETLALLLERHERTATKATKKAARDLFLKVARRMPAGLTDARIEEAGFSDGRPALVKKDHVFAADDVADIVFAEDGNGDVIVLRSDFSVAGHIDHGRVVMLARMVEGEPRPLTSPPAKADLWPSEVAG